MSKLTEALEAARRGMHIFPVARGQKMPHSAAGQWGETATSDLSRVTYFWSHVDPYANIGIACKPSQLLVIDLDIAKEDWKLRGTEWEYLHSGYGPRISGEDVFNEMAYKLSDDEDYDRYVNTLTVRTGSGGIHLYYAWPDHWPKISQASPVKGVIDVRGNGGRYGGYALGPGSVTEAGPYRVTNSLNIKLTPNWIRELVAEKPAPPKIHRPQGIAHLLGGPKNWSGLVNSVQNAGEGNRNNALLWAARAMYTGGASEQECKSTLGPAAESAGLPHYEIERTIQNAYRIQRHKEGR